MVKVLILGGSGMLGQMMDRVLSRSELLTVKQTRRRHESDAFYFDVEEGIHGLRQILEYHGLFDYIINCIGVLRTSMDEQDSKSVHRAIIINSLFPHDLATLTQETGARVIHVSTDGVFSVRAGICHEDTPVDCGDVYGKTKSLGEVMAPNFLILRSSLIGPDPLEKKGLLEWFLSQPPGAQVSGYTDHQWNGVTTLQFVQLCRALIVEGHFEAVRREAHLHHFCPNRAVSKYELLQLFRYAFKTEVTVEPVASRETPVRRVLDTRHKTVKQLFGYGRPMQQAIEELTTEM